MACIQTADQSMISPRTSMPSHLSKLNRQIHLGQDLLLCMGSLCISLVAQLSFVVVSRGLRVPAARRVSKASLRASSETAGKGID